MSRSIWPTESARREEEEAVDEEGAGKGAEKVGRERRRGILPALRLWPLSLLIHLSPVPQHPAAGLGSPSVLTGTQTKLRTRRKVNRSAAPSHGVLVIFARCGEVLIVILPYDNRSELPVDPSSLIFSSP